MGVTNDSEGGDVVGNPLIVADDLSGAAETAAALGAPHRPGVFLWPDAPSAPEGEPMVWDLDSRHLAPADAGARVRAALDAVDDVTTVVKKIDSLLRGNVGAEVEPFVSPGALTVVAPALPPQHRTVVDGVLLDHGVPVAATDLWALEPTAPPARVADVLEGLDVREVDLATVRSDALGAALTDAVGAVAVCDAEDADDLAAIVTAALGLGIGVTFVGSSALARALGPHLPHPATSADAPAASQPDGGVLHVLGTGSAAALAQADELRRHVGLVTHLIAPDELAGLDAAAARAWGRALASDLGARSVLVQIAHETAADATGAQIVAGLARLVDETIAQAPRWPVRLMLTGGQTARAVLDALGCRRLTLAREIHPGAVLMTTQEGGRVATRPGSHGGPDSLWLVHQALTADEIHHTTQENP